MQQVILASAAAEGAENKRYGRAVMQLEAN
jgi:hypothetical protein